MVGRKPRSSLIACTFCGRNQRDARAIIAGPGVYICDECVTLCVEILVEQGDYTVDTSGSLVAQTPRLAPVFNRLDFEPRFNHVFYLCPFAEPFNSIYADSVVPTLAAEGMTVQRADEIFSTEAIIEDVWVAINSCSLVVADVTGKNPNVMYEIGMAHTVGKPVVLITQSMSDVPFDLSHRRCITYEYSPHGCKQLESRLRDTVRTLRDFDSTAID